jgi:hypothetical protein
MENTITIKIKVNFFLCKLTASEGVGGVVPLTLELDSLYR